MSRNEIVAVLAFLFPIAAFFLWPLSFMDWNDGMIDQGWALGMTCAMYVIWKCTNTDNLKKIGQIGFWLCINNDLDEFFFDPLNDSVGEYIFAIVTSVSITYKDWLYKFIKRKQTDDGYNR